jgi:hypothetical protein
MGWASRGRPLSPRPCRRAARRGCRAAGRLAVGLAVPLSVAGADSMTCIRAGAAADMDSKDTHMSNVAELVGGGIDE